MKRRAFLQASSAFVAGSVLTSRTAQGQTGRRTNWAGNHTYKARNLHAPKTVQEVQAAVRSCSTLKSLGTRHSFNPIADNAENQVSLNNLNEVHELDEASRTVMVGAGIRYGELCRYLHDKGHALHNLASLPHISVAGACSTATHGSGVKNGNLATAVSAIEFVAADGEVVRLSRERNAAEFPGAVVGLGALGVVTKVTLDVQPSFDMRQFVYQYLPITQLEEHFDDVMSSGYSVSLFTDWQSQHVNQVWIKRRVDDGRSSDPAPELLGAKLATRHMHPIEHHSAENCTAQMGESGPWYDRLPHFKLDFTPSSGKELQAEYFVPRQHAVDAFMAVQRLGKRLASLLMISEVRTINADPFWMSPCYQQPCVAIHFTWKQDWEALRKLLPVIEAELEPLAVRPHWGKLFTLDPKRLQTRYEKLAEFKQLLHRYDPGGKFRSGFVGDVLYGAT